jgi:hypothetical protein
MSTKGRKQSLEHISKRVETRKKKGSYFMSEKNKELARIRETGKKMSEANKKKLSERVTGEKHPMWKGGPKKYICFSCGKDFSASRERKNVKFCSVKCYGLSMENKKRDWMVGEKNWNWKNGASTRSQLIRKSIEYKLWRKAVLERDNYTCVWCKKVGGNIQADHIKAFCLYPELRFAIDNGRTLCFDCHQKTDNYGFKTKTKK